MGKAEIQAMEDMMQLAKSQAEGELAKVRAEMDAVREESFSLGVLQTLDYQNTHNEMLKYVVLMKLRDAKEYRKSGRTWAQFCEEVLGEDKRNVDRKIADIRPVVDAFGAKMSQIAGLELRQIRLLGRTIGAEMSQIDDGTLVIGNDRIPLDAAHKDDIEAALDALKDAHKALLEEKDATLRAKDKVLAAKDDLLKRQEKDLARYEKEAESQGLALEEAAWLQHLDRFRTTFDGVMVSLDPERNLQLKEPSTTPRMIAAYLTTLDYLKKQICSAHQTAADWYSVEGMEEPDSWVPPHLRAEAGGA